MRRRATEALARVDVHLDDSAILSTHSLAVQQMVAIARAIDISADVLILDEPTSSLDQGEVDQLFAVIRQLASQGIAVVFVSHFLDQVYEIADRMTVLRNGRLVGEWTTAELTRVELVSKMLGREFETLEALEHKPRVALNELEANTPVLEARTLGRKKAIAPFDLAIHRGEVIGLAGLLGSGRTEVARLLFGADRSDSGHVFFDGKPVTIRNPRSATAQGVAFCPENRRTEGLVEDLTVRENIILALQAARGWTRPIPRKRQDELVGQWIRALDIRTADAEQPVRTLSGGNQQKVLLARWLITQPKLLILDEPTRGIDVGAKTEIQRLVVSLCDDGMSVLFISAEIEEVLRPEPQGRGPARPAGRGAARERRRRHDRRPRPHDRRRGECVTRHGSVWPLLTNRLVWPLLSIGVLFVTNLFVSNGFFSVQMRGGHLYGSLIDILSFGAPLILVALGMTLVIATGGIDLSVGAVVAISGALACLMISHLHDQNSITGVLVAVAAALGLAARALERHPRRRHRDPADHRHADPDGRRAGHRPAHHLRVRSSPSRARPTSGSEAGTCSPCRSRSSSSQACSP